MLSIEQMPYVCPVEITLKAIAGKWKPAILWALSTGPKRFSELQMAMPGVAHKVLSQQLAQLQRDGMVMPIEAGDRAPAGYMLTLLGGTLRPALNALASWGKAHGERASAATQKAAR